MDDLARGDIDCGILWGPMAGFYAQQATPPLIVVPLTKETMGPPMIYRIGMAVRQADQELKRTLNQLIMENQAEINRLLISYNIPILDEDNRPITAETLSSGHDCAALRFALSRSSLPPPRRKRPTWPSRTAIASRITARRRPRRCVAPG